MDTTDISPALLGLAQQQAVKVDTTVSTMGLATFGVLSARPAAAGIGGSVFWATDQCALYLSNGSDWIRIGEQAGNIIWTNEASARAGYVLLDGSALASTGIYADLYALWGGTLPDVRGREFVAKGTHADVSSMLNTEGVALANRTPQHNSSVDEHGGHAHDLHTVQTGAIGADVWTTPSGSPGLGSIVQSATTGITVGPGGTRPIDSAAYIVLQPQAKL